MGTETLVETVENEVLCRGVLHLGRKISKIHACRTLPRSLSLRGTPVQARLVPMGGPGTSLVPFGGGDGATVRRKKRGSGEILESRATVDCSSQADGESKKKARKNGSLSLAVEIAGDLAAIVVACG